MVKSRPSSINISGEKLADLLDVDPRKYNYLSIVFKKVVSVSDECEGRGLEQELKVNFNLSEIFALKKIPGFPVGTRKVVKVTNGKYASGEIWRDHTLNKLYFYVGKRSDNYDVVLNLNELVNNLNELGLYGSIFDVGRINNKRYEIFFDEKIFPRAAFFRKTQEFCNL